MKTIFITGGTGYIGSRLIRALVKRGGYRVKALIRANSLSKLPAGCEAVIGDALDYTSYQQELETTAVFVHLVGVAHPSPAKAAAFRNIDLASVTEALKATAGKPIERFIYLSVAMYPTKIMAAFQSARAEGERLLLAAPFPSTFIRPWYVLGPGHWWPIILKPLYALMRIIPGRRQMAAELSTVTIAQMINTLLKEIDHDAAGNRIIDVAAIKKNR